MSHLTHARPILFFFAVMLGAACGPSDLQKSVSADFPYESRYATVLGSKMHYVEVGQGDPILFLHGNPTSSYLWRNVIPHLKDSGRCIAVDLIGMGKSDKPDLDYRFADHARYLEEFIRTMKLRNVTLVIHDWGSGLGFHYATRHQSNVKGIAFMEALTRPTSWDEFNFIERFVFKRFRDPVKGRQLLIEENAFIEDALPRFVARDLTKAEMDHYRAPFLKKEHRKPVWMWPNQIPIDGEPAEVHKLVSEYNQKLRSWQVPKLLLYAEPGAIIKGKEAATRIAGEFPNTDIEYIGGGIHFVQEDNPDRIGRAIADWMKRKGL